MKKFQWDAQIVSAARQNKLAFFVGNGLSRLCGAPSWSTLLSSLEIRKLLTDAKIESFGLSNYEIASIIQARFQTSWMHVLQKLDDWGYNAKPSVTHKVLGNVFRLKVNEDRKHRIFTSNIDTLLRECGVLDNTDIVYCHGQPGDIKNWIFTHNDLIENYDKGMVAEAFEKIGAKAIIFVGYSHSHEDFDIANACGKILDKNPGMYAYSLAADSGDISEALKIRLNAQKIKLLTYDIPFNADLRERDAALAHILLDLAEAAELQHADSDTKLCFTEYQKWCNDRFSENQIRRDTAAIVIGLAATNHHLQLNGNIPTGHRRHSTRAEIHTEAGGPGYIVSRIVQAIGADAFLVAKIATDGGGRNILSEIETKNGENLSGKIFTRYIDIAEPDSSAHGFQTWTSFILEPSDPNLHRVFIDRSVESSSMDIRLDFTTELSKELQSETPRIVYFDKFYRSTIQRVFQNINAVGGKFLSEKVWTVYESGSEGDRYFGTRPGKEFVSKDAYMLEKFLSAEHAKCVNIITASFRFARDYLARTVGGLSQRSYRKLIHAHDSAEIKGSYRTDRDEDQVIDNMLSDENMLAMFCAAVACGGRKFLREHELRMIFVTLHRRGCIVITVSAANEIWFQHIDGEILPQISIYNASAGDVFRGALVAALMIARRNGKSAKDIMTSLMAANLGRLCNQCAAHKVSQPTVSAAVDGIAEIILEWKNSNGFV